MYPDVFEAVKEYEEEELGHTITEEFKKEVHDLCEKLEKVIYDTPPEDWEERRERGYYIIAKLAYAHMPSPEDEGVKKVEFKYVEKYNID